ncbi:SMC-Scp complex subunit ScpB [Desertivirga xinjiangensis]|uniref:SMC-Scp complex subunit ScpB n=1 Tax=Desertivirga xinjiangensis TaxID=539206 RepID=UPI00210ED3B9|nr:SMC-Scp complex subunit ScpB [Pedobacter xinjiangensis]
MPKKTDLEQLQLNIEALIFASEQSLTSDEIVQVLQGSEEETLTAEKIASHLEIIRRKYDSDEFAFSLVQLNGGYQFLTKKRFHQIVNQLQMQRSKKKLSQAALETLAIIAYRQPITKLEIEQIRGVSCDYTIQKLLEKELITISGKAETIGKPILYSTSSLFMDYFGINSSAELPQLKDIATDENEIGENKE